MTTKADLVRQALEEDPTKSVKQIAEECEVSTSQVYQIRNGGGESRAAVVTETTTEKKQTREELLFENTKLQKEVKKLRDVIAVFNRA